MLEYNLVVLNEFSEQGKRKCIKDLTLSYFYNKLHEPYKSREPINKGDYVRHGGKLHEVIEKVVLENEVFIIIDVYKWKV